MANNLAQVTEVRTVGGGAGPHQPQTAFIACGAAYVPFPGEYLMASPLSPGDRAGFSEVLPEVLFRGLAPYAPISPTQSGFWAAAPISSGWLPGLKLRLRGPIGKGFRPPEDSRKLALVNAGGGAGCLLALAEMALQKDCPVVFLGDTADSPKLPAEVEVYPLESLQEMSGWADHLAVDVPLDRLADLPKILGVSTMRGVSVPVEVLVRSPMPCGGIGKCGVCAFQRGRERLLACEDGPVIRYGR